MTTMNPQQTLMQVATGYLASTCLYVAARLRVADLLADGPRPVADLASSTGTLPDALHRVLRLLVSVGIFSESAPRVFALNDAAQLLRSGTPGSLHGMALFLPDPFHYRIYAELLSSVQTDTPAAEKVLGMPLFDYLATDPAYSEIFNDAMTALSAPAIGAALVAYDFSRHATIVDVAGGHGEVLTAILRACPQ